MPWVPVHVEKDGNQIATPTTSPSASATWANTAGSPRSGNRAAASWPSLASTSCSAFS